MARISAVATGATELAVINAARRVALALPSNEEVAQLVLGLYQPRRIAGRCFKQVAGSLNRLDLGPFSHHFAPISRLTPATEWLCGAADAGTIGFLGCNPAHGLRCILTGILPETGEAFIAKLGFDASLGAVKQEYDTLTKIAHRYPGVAQAISGDQGDDWFLMRLPHLGNKTPGSMIDDGIDSLLLSWLNDDDIRLGVNPWASDLIQMACVDRTLRGWHRHMEQLSVRSALIHGDFAIWNLRQTENGVQAIDWEWAHTNGISGVDLVHGLRQEAHLIHKMSAPAAIAWMRDQATHSPWSKYIKESGWAGEIDNWLRMGLLHSHYNAQSDSQLLLRELGIHVN